MLILTTGLVVSSFIIAQLTPLVYKMKRADAITQNELLLREESNIKKHNIFSLVIFLCPLLLLHLSGNTNLFYFSLLMAIGAYTDLSTRWIPDPVIYLLLALSLLSIDKSDVTQYWGMVFYLLPVILLNIFCRIFKGGYVIASGDMYIFPSVGLMVSPEHASELMALNLVFCVIISRWVKQIPLVTVAYFTFIGYQLCALSGFL